MARMADEARRARLLSRMNEMLELVECDMRDDEAGWEQRVDALAQRRDGSLEEVVRILSQWGAYTTLALAQQAGTRSGRGPDDPPDIDEALHESRLVLTQWIESQV
jgi:hypothetical protein